MNYWASQENHIAELLSSAIRDGEKVIETIHCFQNENDLPSARMGMEVSQIGSAIGLLQMALESIKKNGLPKE